MLTACSGDDRILCCKRLFGFVRGGIDHGVVRELVTAPNLRIRRHRVVVVLTIRITSDLRLLRILTMDVGMSRTLCSEIYWAKAALGFDGLT
jgi:hypothetical protein